MRLTETDADTYSQALDSVWGSIGKVRGRNERSEVDGIPRERQTLSTKLYTYELPGNKVPSREHTQAVLRTLVHMEHRTTLSVSV